MKVRLTPGYGIIIEATDPAEMADLDSLATRVRGEGLQLASSGGDYGPSGQTLFSVMFLPRGDTRLGRPAPSSEAEADVGVQDQARVRLLARMAGNIAAGLVSPTTNGTEIWFWNDHYDAAKEVANEAVDLAEAILARLEKR